ncbi:MAG: D-glycerate 3-kinase [Candidatus Azotimanducaceae bacterium]
MIEAKDDALRKKARAIFNLECSTQSLSLPDAYFAILYQTAHWLETQCRDRQRKTMGISGAQGSGKSTFAKLLATLLIECFETRTLVLSLDDFYLTRAERSDLTSISPLLQTRGVPGTHDLALCLEAIENFSRGEPMRIPEFSKPHDDRIDERIEPGAGLQLLILEGWCWGAEPEEDAALIEPINELEHLQDAKGVWRRYVNDQLKAYQPLFDTDISLFLKVPDLDAVKRWRWQQEQGLPVGPARMSQTDVTRFIMYYERITRRLLACRPAQVDICLSLDSDHAVRVDKFPAI